MRITTGKPESAVLICVELTTRSSMGAWFYSTDICSCVLSSSIGRWQAREMLPRPGPASWPHRGRRTISYLWEATLQVLVTAVLHQPRQVRT